MRKITATMLVLILVAVICLTLTTAKVFPGNNAFYQQTSTLRTLSVSTPNPIDSPTVNSLQSQQTAFLKGTHQPQQTINEESSSLPSPFIIAGFIVALVAVFGLILSMSLRKRAKRSLR
jgi:hypothetical protein